MADEGRVNRDEGIKRRVKTVEEILNRIFEGLIGRVSGPMKFRLILQPLMAIIFAVRSGLQDAKEGRPPYFWALFTQPDHRRTCYETGGRQWAKSSSSQS